MSDPQHAPGSDATRTRPTIRISRGVGEGRTRLAAFDAALRAAGIADHNLIRLSSVIPPDTDVVEVSAQDQLRGGFGDRLYCVYAADWATEVGTEVWAGIGWARSRDGSGAGLFVEHGGHSETDVRHQIEYTLSDMSAGRGGAFVYEDAVLAGGHCRTWPTCALVVATYETTPWASL